MGVHSLCFLPYGRGVAKLSLELRSSAALHRAYARSHEFNFLLCRYEYCCASGILGTGMAVYVDECTCKSCSLRSSKSFCFNVHACGTY